MTRTNPYICGIDILEDLGFRVSVGALEHLSHQSGCVRLC